MSIKKWIAVGSLMVTTALVSAASIAGYDTRGESNFAKMRCDTTNYYHYVHKACMETCSSRHGSSWDTQQRYGYFRDCYESCSHDMHARCGMAGDYYPKQAFSRPTP